MKHQLLLQQNPRFNLLPTDDTRSTAMYFIKLTILIFAICVISESFSVTNTNCLINFINKFVPKRSITFLVPEEDKFSLTYDLNSLYIPVTTFKLSEHDTAFSSDASSSYVISVNIIGDLEKALKFKQWNLEASYLVVMNISGNAMNVSQQVLDMFRSSGIFNVVTAVYDETGTNLGLYTWYPFNYENQCAQKVHQLEATGCHEGIADLFANKVPNSFFKCKFVAAWFYGHPEGPDLVDRVFFAAFAEKYNLSLE